MFQLTQFIQNAFIRIFGTIAQLFGFVGQFLRQLGGITNRIFGFSNKGGYFLNSNDAQTIKRIEDRSTAAPESSQRVVTEPAPNSNSSASQRTSRRRPGKEISHFRDMARQIRKS